MRLAVPALAAALLASCAPVRGTMSSERVERGAPLEDPGPGAYRVWQDGDGWHLRVTSEVPRRFHGRIGSEVSRVRGHQLPEGAVAVTDGAVTFSFVASGEAGFDWGGSGCQEAALYVDGDARPLRVALGAWSAAPVRVPFRVCP